MVRATRSVRCNPLPDRCIRLAADSRLLFSLSPSKQTLANLSGESWALATALALFLARPAAADPLLHHGGGFARIPGCQQIARGYATDLDMQVDAVQQRAGHARPVALNLVRCATAGAFCVAEKAAGAGIHGRDQLEAGRVGDPVTGAGEGDLAGFHGFPENLQAVTAEFRQFVEKKYAAVGQGNLARARFAATADQGCGSGAVVGTAKGPLKNKFALFSVVVNIAQGQTE